VSIDFREHEADELFKPARPVRVVAISRYCGPSTGRMLEDADELRDEASNLWSRLGTAAFLRWIKLSCRAPRRDEHRAGGGQQATGVQPLIRLGLSNAAL
jgi:hypothetical protein